VGDCTLRETAEAAVAQALEQFGRIDCAVQLVGGGNRAGVNFWSETDEDWDRILRTSLKTHMYLLRAVVEPMKQRGSGSIVLLSADSGRNGGGVVNLVAYSAAKAAVIALAKSAARDLGGHGIRVNCVSPGPTDTVKPGAVSGAVEAATAAIVASTPMGRRAQPEEVAAAVAWFCSPASRFVTGQTLSVNGGMLMPG
jgi:NAD(P)-dependent dehydrogenase (short-subunit alcohol dehydrogenase family)